ncbi:hypothetical protein JNUCC1_02154 [Lentibacillus sp. JNUCC-1]|uniref:hypothetical protein n=1 Tax=Lentibacillus sp. JNUCC-1 TaxID=2654513 RepID=UPI0012E8A8AD|nr:hypothetical protein [Lentibacillus sp. JNUCC-1]MUV38316.1 hypothetical protein [Lentibacillus sp. JNUCC-1]
MWILLDVLEVLFFSIDMRNPEEHDINRNIAYLKKEQWFQDLLNDSANQRVVTRNKQVRKVIGRMNPDKMHRAVYHDRQQTKITHTILKNTG